MIKLDMQWLSAIRYEHQSITYAMIRYDLLLKFFLKL